MKETIQTNKETNKEKKEEGRKKGVQKARKQDGVKEIKKENMKRIFFQKTEGRKKERKN